MAKVLSCRGSRLTWTAQRELDAQVIRGVEAHKAVLAFLRTATVRMDPSIVPRTVPRTVNGQRCGLSNYRTGEHVIGLGDGMAGHGYVHGPTV